MKKLLLVLTAIIFSIIDLKAEGTAQTSPGGDRRADLTINRGGEYSIFAHTSSGPLDRLYLNVKGGETVYFAFQRGNGTSSTLRIRRNSDNAIVKTYVLSNSGNGYASSYARAVAGPNAVAGTSGYPVGSENTWAVAPSDSGLYYLEFSASSNLLLRYYDVTVVNSSNTVQPGRLWAYRWNLDCGSFTQPFEGSFYSYTSDSTVAELDLNGFKPYVWTIMLNDFGPQTGGTVSQNRKSRSGNFGVPQYPLFLNDPDNSLYPTGGVSTVNTTNTPTITGCLGDYCVNAFFNGGGVGEIVLDLNGTPGFQANSQDVYLTQTVTTGWNCFQWDGLDGLGNVATGVANISVTASVITGITHFPIYDAECNENGFEVRRVRPGAGNAFLLWDNTSFTGGTSDTIVGCLSGGSCNEWGPGTSQSTSTVCGGGNSSQGIPASFGDRRTINTWWYGFKDTAPFTGITVTGSIGFVTLNTTSITCNGLNNGEIDLDITGGEPPFSIAWSNGVNQAGVGTNYSITNLGPGTYDVTVTDNAGCTVVSSGTVNEPTALSVSLLKTDIDCFGESTGSINSTVTGGTELGGGGYSYSWSNGQSSPDISALPQGTYTVTVTDANGCTETASITVDQSPQLVLTLSETSSVTCFGGSDGEASASASGGQGPYTYAWSNGGGGTSQTGLQGGSYTVTATDNLGCQVIESVTITQPANAVGAVATVTDPTTLGGSDGEISVAISNGVAPYTITWTGGGPISTSSNPYVISGLSQGNYNITVVDDNGCSANTSVILNDPSCNITITDATTDVTCNGGNDGSASLTVTGANPPVSYTWSNGGTTSSISGLTQGTYSYTVTDAAGCGPYNGSLTVNEPTALSVSITATTTVSCNGGNDGIIQAVATGGTGSYTFVWNTSDNGNTLSGLSAGNYSVTVTDDNGCTANASTTLADPTPISITSVDSDVQCNGGSDGSIVLSVSGGAGGYTYAWSNGEVTSDIAGLTANTYTVTVTDANSCTETYTTTINEPANPLSASASITNVDCNGNSTGAITVTPSGGTSGYTYAWAHGPTTATITSLTAGSYTVTVTDAQACTFTDTYTVTQPDVLTLDLGTFDPVNCNGESNGVASVDAFGGTTPYTYLWPDAGNGDIRTNLAAGTYTVTVTDQNLCTATYTVTMTEPNTLTISASESVTVSCNGLSDGEATTTVSGGNGSYTYLWSNGQTTSTATGLAAGTYTVTVTDFQSCTASTSVTIVEPALLTLSAAQDNPVSCNGLADGQATATPTGGNGTNTFAWSNGQTTATATGLSAGTYTVTVMDVKGCTANTSVTITEPAVLTLSAAQDNAVSCNGLADGQATATPTGGNGSNTFLWSDGQTGATATGLAAGTYTVTVTDAEGCTANASVTITEPATLTLSATQDDPVSCNGLADGEATAAPVGGNGGNTFLWSNGQTTATATGLAAGSYSVTVSDAQGCTANASVTITEPTTLTLSATQDDPVSCNGLSDGMATATAADGNGGYTYEWSDGQNTATATGLAAGTYTVTVTDAKNCTASTSVVISEPAQLTVTPTVSDVLCFGGNTGSISLSVTGGNGSYTYNWNTGATTSSISNLSTGNYAVTVTDAKNCQEILSSIFVDQPNQPLSSDTLVVNVSGFGSANGSIDLIVSGGTPSYGFEWNTGATTEDISGLVAGWYYVTITDAHGCTSVDSALVDQNIPPVALEDNSTTDEDVPVTNQVVANDTDSDGNIDPSTLSIYIAPINGTTTIDPITGSITYTPNPNYFGLDSLAYIICDDGTPLPSECDTAWWYLDILPVNDCPVLTFANGVPVVANTVNAVNIIEDTPTSICLDHTDIDGDDIRITSLIFTGNSNGLISGISDGDECITFTPNPNYTGPATIRLRYCDNASVDQCCQDITIHLNIQPVNDPPVALNNLVSTPEDTPILVNPLNNDNDNRDNSPLDTSSVVIIGGPSNGSASVDPNTGEINYTPNQDWNGIDTITYAVCDLGVPLPSLCDTALIIIQVTPVNDPPVIDDVNDTLPLVTTPEDTSIEICLAYIDIDGDLASITEVISAPNHGSLSGVSDGDSCLVYTPNPDYYGPDTLEISLCDLSCQCQCDTTTIIIDVTPVNDPPIARINNVQTDEDVTVTFDPLNNDDDQSDGLELDSTSVAILDGPSNGSVVIDPVTGEMTYTPDLDFVGNDTIEYSVCDNGFPLPPLCTSSFIYIAVNSDNDPPVINNGNGNPNTNDTIYNIVTLEDTPIEICLDATDIENHNIDIENVISGADFGIISGLDDNDTCITYSPDSNYWGGDTITVSVCDNGIPNLCVEITIIIDVLPVNDPPIALDNSLITQEESPVTANVINNDNDDQDGLEIDTASFAVIDGPNNGTYTYNSVTGQITYTPNPDFYGNDTIVYSICDQGFPLPSLCDTASIFIRVEPINDPPIANGDQVTTDEDTDVVIAVLNNDSDQDGILDPLTITLISGPTFGSATIDPITGDITYSPQPEYSGPDQFIYEVCDDGMPVLCDTAIVNIVVIPVNDPPIAEFDVDITNEDTPVSITVLDNDFDTDGEIDSTSVAVVNPPVHGSAIWNSVTGEFIYTPNPNFNGNDGFTYVICDDGMPVLCDTTFVNITINSVNDAPIANQDNTTTPENQSVSISPLTNDIDPENGLNINSLTILNGPSNGTAQIGQNGVVNYTPANGFNGIDSILYQICDNGSPVLCDTAFMIINVTPVNDPPVASADYAATNINVAVDIQILNNDSDIDGFINPSSYTLISDFNQGTGSYNPATGVLTYLPNNGFIGLDSMIYQICDNGSPVLCDTALVVVEVSDVNIPPVATNDSYSIVQGNAMTVTVVSNDSDPNSGLNLPSLTEYYGPSNGSAVWDNSGNLTYTSNNGFVGIDSMGYIICDDGAPTGVTLCDTAFVYFTVQPRTITAIANPFCDADAPFVNYQVTADNFIPSSGLTITWLDTNMNAVQTLTNQATTGTIPWPGAVFDGFGNIVDWPGWALINGIWVPANDGFQETRPFAYIVFSLNPSDTVLVNYPPTQPDCNANPPQNPIALPDDVNTDQDTPITFDPLNNDSDPDGDLDTSSVVVTTPPSNGSTTVDPNGNITYTPNPGFVGNDTLIYQVCDQDMPALCDTALVTIVVGPVNQPPVAIDDAVDTDEDTPVVFDPLDNDGDPEGSLDTSSVAITTPPSNGSASVGTDGTITYTPNPGFVGSDTLIYQVCDQASPALCDTALVAIEVNPVFNPPVANADNASTLENTPVNIAIVNNDSDPDGDLDITSISIVNQPTNGSISILPSGEITYTPNQGFDGVDSFIYQICDQSTPVLCDTALVTVTVINVPVPPIANQDNDTTLVGTPVVIDPVDNDIDGDGDIDNGSVTVITPPNNGTVTTDPNGNVTYTPDSGFEGSDTLTYEVCDLSSPTLCDTAIIVIEVEKIEPPVAQDDYVTTVQNQTVTILPISNDSDPNNDIVPSSLTIITGPSNGTASVNGSQVQYTPYGGFTGNDAIVYQICDATALCDTAVIYISVDGFVALNCPSDIIVNAPADQCGRMVNWNLPTFFSTYTPVQITRLDVTGFNPGDFIPVGTHQIVYEAEDNNGNRDTCSFTITVNDVTPPTVVCPSPIVMSSGASQCGSVVNFTMPVAQDACGIDTSYRVDLLPFESGDLWPVGTYLVQWRYIDVTGLITDCQMPVSVIDNVDPIFTDCPSDTVLYSNGSCAVNFEWKIPQATDNCTPVTISRLDNTGLNPNDAFGVGTTTIQYGAVDQYGNATVCDFSVTVMDTAAPVITCPGTVTVNTDLNSCSAVVNYTVPTAIGSCGNTVTVTQISGLGSGATYPLGTTTEVYQVVDQNGNRDTCSFDVVVTDTESPQLNCIADASFNTSPGSCLAEVTFATPTATDNCSNAVMNQISGPNSGDSLAPGIYTIQFEATDDAGNKDTCSATLTVNDNQAPVLSCSSDISVNSDPGTCGATVNWNAPTASDQCGIGSITQIEGIAPGGVFPIGTTRVSYVAVDLHGNADTCSFNVVVSDNESPVINCIADETFETDNGSCQTTVTFNLPAATDNCGSVSVVQISGPASGDVLTPGVYSVAFEATDSTGNTATCSATITVVDNQAPSIACQPDINIYNDLDACGAVTSWNTPIATDNCSVDTVYQIAGPISGSTIPVGVNVITYVAEDANGNMDTCSFNVTVFDTQSPTITCPADMSISASQDDCGAVAVWNIPVATDNCGSTVVNQIGGPTSGSVLPVGITTITYAAVDLSGNADTCSFTVTVTDDQAPEIACPTDVIVSSEQGVCGATLSFTAPAVTDNCSGVVITQTAGPANGSFAAVGTHVIEFTATDASGNTSVCSYTITVEDTEAPAINCPTDITAYTDSEACWTAVNYAMPTATDNCSGVTIAQTGSNQLASGALFPLGTTTLEFTATDASGNTTVCSFTVTVVDTTAPSFTICPTQITAQTDAGDCSAVVNFPAPQAIDNCLGVTVAQTDNSGLSSGDAFPIGNTTITYTATDASGNTTTCSFDVVVTDNQAPDLSCTSNVTAVADQGACSAVVNFTVPTATDNCGPVTVNQISGLASGSSFPVGITDMVFVATDSNGNTDTCAFQVIVEDLQAPSIVCPSNITVSNDANSCGAVVNYTLPTASDNCSNVTITRTAGPAPGGLFPIGTTTVTYVAQDGNGNADTCSFTVTVNDTEDPTIACPGNITVDTDVNQCGAIVNFNVIANDNCQGFVLSQTDNTGLTNGSFFPIGTTTLTYQVTDAAGNTVSCTFDVTVEDNDPPTLTCPGNINIPLTNDCEYVLEDYTQIVIAADNCGNQQTVTVSQNPAPGVVMVDGDVQTVVITATDQNGNTSTCSFVVSVRDAVAPVVVCGGIQTDSVKADTDCRFEVGDYTAGVSVSDNCTDSADFTITQSPAPGTMVNGSSGVVTVSVVVTGPDEFESTCYTDIIVECTDELSIPNGFSPNGDGLNDFFVIEGIDAYPNNNIKIFNRWGNLVYERDRYQNDWDGTASDGSAVVSSGERLPPGTYFYIFNTGIPGEDPIQGYIYLNQ